MAHKAGRILCALLWMATYAWCIGMLTLFACNALGPGEDLEILRNRTLLHQRLANWTSQECLGVGIKGGSYCSPGAEIRSRTPYSLDNQEWLPYAIGIDDELDDIVFHAAIRPLSLLCAGMAFQSLVWVTWLSLMSIARSSTDQVIQRNATIHGFCSWLCISIVFGLSILYRDNLVMCGLPDRLL